jgi:histidinol-phosphate aminotransferase
VSRGIEVHIVDEPSTAAGFLSDVEAWSPALLHLDRPNFTGEVWDLREVVALAGSALRMGALLLIDESASPYLGPGGSCVPLVNRLENLVVLRGFTKGCSWGGLRAGYAVASRQIADQVRELVAPMQISELALQGVLRLLECGDIFSALRARIRVVKPQFRDLLRGAGLPVVDGHPDLPWVALRDPAGETSAFLGQLGIRPLRPVPMPVDRPHHAEMLRLTVPLSDERIAACESHFAGARAAGMH